MRLFRTLTVAVFCLGLSAPLRADDKISVRNHYESGKVYTMENKMEMSAGIPGAGGAASQQTNMTMTMTITVKDDAGSGNRLATVKFTGVTATMNMMGQTMTYDSADPSKSQPYLQQAFGAMLGKEFTLVYDKDDKVTDVRAADSLSSPVANGTVVDAKGNVADVRTPAASGPKGMDVKQLAEVFKKSQEMFLPPQPVAPGDTWNYEGKVEMPPMGSMVSKGTGKFDSIVDVDGHKHAKLLINGALSVADASIPVKLGEGSAVSVELLYDLDRRLADTVTTSNDIKINAAGQDVSMKQKAVTKITSVADAPK